MQEYRSVPDIVFMLCIGLEKSVIILTVTLVNKYSPNVYYVPYSARQHTLSQ